METHKNIAASINQLIEINNDRIEGYKKAIELLPEGDHYVRVRLEISQSLYSEEKKLYEQLSSLKSSKGSKKKGWF